MLWPSWSLHSSRWPPPGAMITPAPFFGAVAGRYTVMEGLWTFATTRSPFGCAIRVVSSAVFPSDPGAPLGHRTRTCGSAAKQEKDAASKVKTSKRGIEGVLWILQRCRTPVQLAHCSVGGGYKL